jgi:hypothetical protein
MPLMIKELLGDNTHQASPRLTFPLSSKASTDCIILHLGFRFIFFTLCNGFVLTYMSFYAT